MKYLLGVAAVLAGDPTSVDPRVEALTDVFQDLASCEAAKRDQPGRERARSAARRFFALWVSVRSWMRKTCSASRMA
jgi:hypothetical protein